MSLVHIYTVMTVSHSISCLSYLNFNLVILGILETLPRHSELIIQFMRVKQWLYLDFFLHIRTAPRLPALLLYGGRSNVYNSLIPMLLVEAWE